MYPRWWIKTSRTLAAYFKLFSNKEVLVRFRDIPLIPPSTDKCHKEVCTALWRMSDTLFYGALDDVLNKPMTIAWHTNNHNCIKTVNTQHTDRRHNNAIIHTNILIIFSCSGSGYRHKLACTDLHTKELTCSSDSYMPCCFTASRPRRNGRWATLICIWNWVRSRASQTTLARWLRSRWHLAVNRDRARFKR